MIDFGLVSVIMPSYNCGRFVGATIDSIIAQTYENWELLITDDGSTDDSMSIIRQYASRDPRIKVYSLDGNYGAGVARNNSIKEASGRYIAFCDSDDRWYPEKLETQLAFMAEKGCCLSYTSYMTCDEEDELVGIVNCLPAIGYRQILRDNGIGCLTAIYDVGKIGKNYFQEIRKRQDWCLWISIIKAHGTALGLREPLAYYRVRSNSVSSNKVALLKWNYQVYRNLGYGPVSSGVLLGGYFLPYYVYKKVKQKRDFRNIK